VVAANKIDTIAGWNPTKEKSFLKALKEQSKFAREKLDNKIYDLMTSMADYGFNADLFTRVEDHTKTITIIPCSAKTGEGIAELITTLAGLAQRFLGKKLVLNEKIPAKGSVLEVKEEKGLGTTIDVIIYDGIVRKGDYIIIAGIEKAITTKIRALLEPAPLQEIREKGKFMSVEKVAAAAGVKISAPGLEEVIPGMPIRIVWDEEKIDEIKQEIQEEISKITIETEKEGVIIKADTLGSLEAIIGLLKKEGITVRKAHIGHVNKKDIIDAASVKEEAKDFRVILAFNVKTLDDAKELAKDNDIKIIEDRIIYKLLEDYQEWKKENIDKKKSAELKGLIQPAKIRVLPGFVFRQSKPAICGVEVLDGELEKGVNLMKEEGSMVGTLVAIQDQGKAKEKAKRGDKVAASIDNATVGRNLKEGDVLITDMSSENFRNLKKHINELKADKIQLIKEIASIKRKKDPLWGY